MVFVILELGFASLIAALASPAPVPSVLIVTPCFPVAYENTHFHPDYLSYRNQNDLLQHWSDTSPCSAGVCCLSILCLLLCWKLSEMGWALWPEGLAQVSSGFVPCACTAVVHSHCPRLCVFPFDVVVLGASPLLIVWLGEKALWSLKVSCAEQWGLNSHQISASLVHLPALQYPGQVTVLARHSYWGCIRQFAHSSALSLLSISWMQQERVDLGKSGTVYFSYRS